MDPLVPHPVEAGTIHAHFAAVPDPRVARTRRHDLLDILTIALCAILCGADTWVDVERFGHAKEAWLRRVLPLPGGIPSHDTFGRVFAALDPVAFEAAFQGWVQTLLPVPDPGAGTAAGAGTACHSPAAAATDVIAIDGKTLRRSHDRAHGQRPLHLVSAWASAHRLVLGQVAAADHSNEITAIPVLLELLGLDGSIVTIDAMGCQTAIAGQIQTRGADYVLAVKENQGTLHEQLSDHFALVRTDPHGAPSLADRTPHYQTVDQGHGRKEVRDCWVTDDPAVVTWVDPTRRWPGLRSVALVLDERRVGIKVTREPRYFISSLPADPVRLAALVRGHWGIENQCHWILDVAFREDESRVRIGYAAQNLALLRHLALNLLRRETSVRVGVKAKRLMAGWDEQYLLKLLSS